jgi:hypothetical protein
MSTGADLRFVEATPGEWFYEYQCYPYGQNEDYDVYGPFSSEDAARDHCDDNHANAGGSYTLRHKGKDHKLSGKPESPRRRRSLW